MQTVWALPIVCIPMTNCCCCCTDGRLYTIMLLLFLYVIDCSCLTPRLTLRYTTEHAAAVATELLSKSTGTTSTDTQYQNRTLFTLIVSDTYNGRWSGAGPGAARRPSRHRQTRPVYFLVYAVLLSYTCFNARPSCSYVCCC